MKLAALVMGIVGAIAVFFGLVLLLVDDDETIAFSGFSSRAGDIAAGWGWALLIAGIALLAGVAVVVTRLRRPPAG